MAKFDNQLRAKWAGQGVYHNERAAVLCRQGVRAFLAGEVDAASRAFERALELYPDDPNAMHGKARVAIARGNRVLAERCARAAVEINPMAAEYRARSPKSAAPIHRRGAARRLYRGWRRVYAVVDDATRRAAVGLTPDQHRLRHPRTPPSK